jgi:hypothetical protein
MTIERYDWTDNAPCRADYYLEPTTEGEWCQYDDAAAEINRLTVFAGTQTDECARLRAQNERLRAEVALAWDDEDETKRADAAEARVRELEAENERLRADLDKERRFSAYVAGGGMDDIASRVSYAEARVRELEAENESIRTEECTFLAGRLANLEHSIAAATALLVDIREWERAQVKGRVSREPWHCLMNALDAFLANQPAAPAKARASSGGPCPCGDQGRPGHPVGWCAEQDAKRQPGKAPARTESCPFGGVCHKMLKLQEMLTRTKADQAVLDAMAKADITAEGHFTDERYECEAGLAELARRGLK